jgi:hypothetical protein
MNQERSSEDYKRGRGGEDNEQKKRTKAKKGNPVKGYSKFIQTSMELIKSGLVLCSSKENSVKNFLLQS